MKAEQPVCISGNTDDEGEVYFLPRTTSQLTVKQECPQHLTNPSIHSSPTQPAAPIPLNYLTDPMTDKIVLSTVSEEMWIFAQAYNRMLDTLGEMIRMAECGLQE
ncbi:hypothetical protein M404DRAFT_20347 [Pisolithus tinctorius Marx 270]|uniref:Uncharacterized protein n=1 Tax=Pisolithus tinctorius Marx 270 TaxID=870435 RepID=A0A0C3PD80_PISTI|nr:hypothetical protein M404DRAFT_20347 [Pisolithus tinctorius Marx 270]